VPISAQSSLSVGFDALRANPLRTLLSTLGVVMGVGAMVSVLSMGDGVERFAREQIESTTDLLGIAITPVTQATVDGITVRRDDIVRFTAADAAALAEAAQGEERVGLLTTGATLVAVGDSGAPRGFAILGGLATLAEDRGLALRAGRFYADGDTAVIVLNEAAAKAVALAVTGDSTPSGAVGQRLLLQGNAHEVIGVVGQAEGETSGITGFLGSGGLAGLVPVDDAARALGGPRTPQMTLTARRIEDVDSLRATAERWLEARHGAGWGDRVRVQTNQARVTQVATGMLIFKVLMGSITGVALLVGGIGIMNVLLAAVAERTREIGIRKATGARDRDILVQFLSESVAITGAGAAVGVLLGLGIAQLAAWIMRTQTKAPVEAAITPGTILVAAGAAVAIGLVFGLYPALRASRLSPIDAIRHE
jgi:putative ABC transport system permease protein